MNDNKECMEAAQNSLGGRIADLLEKRGMTQRELAAEINSTEVSVSRYIKNQRTPSGPMILAIANALGVSCDYLLGIGPKIPEGYVSIAEVKELCEFAANNVEYCRRQEYEVFKKQLNNGGAVILNDHAKAVQFFESRYCMYHFDIPSLIDQVASGEWRKDEDGKKET